MKESAQSRINRYQKAILMMAERLEQHFQPWTDIAKQTLTRTETEAVQKYINDHLNYPEAIHWQ